ncbi:MAG TPA: hypothetical protein VEK38_04155, partial [Candidatus Bathyarchaeia archaeon]|nr:hypothetical protein [Candidatus Bathyarchaeia archaeon]
MTKMFLSVLSLFFIAIQTTPYNAPEQFKKPKKQEAFYNKTWFKKTVLAAGGSAVALGVLYYFAPETCSYVYGLVFGSMVAKEVMKNKPSQQNDSTVKQTPEPAKIETPAKSTQEKLLECYKKCEEGEILGEKQIKEQIKSTFPEQGPEFIESAFGWFKIYHAEKQKPPVQWNTTTNMTIENNKGNGSIVVTKKGKSISVVLHPGNVTILTSSVRV